MAADAQKDFRELQEQSGFGLKEVEGQNPAKQRGEGQGPVFFFWKGLPKVNKVG